MLMGFLNDDEKKELKAEIETVSKEIRAAAKNEIKSATANAKKSSDKELSNL
jgi:hypothetical protein